MSTCFLQVASGKDMISDAGINNALQGAQNTTIAKAE
jgi:hypothetical protein